MKRLVIGDIHGCYAELQDLLDKAGLSSEDEIIGIGDVVDRGPESVKVFQFFRDQPRARSLMGNHERKHVRSLHGRVRPALSQKITRHQFGEEAYPAACDEMSRWPTSIELPEALLVHGMFEPGIPLSAQREEVIVGTLTGEGHLAAGYDRPWFELYDGEFPIIAGHHDYSGCGRPTVVNDRVFCIDTGCYKGRALTGLILPEFTFVSVPSRCDYWSKAQQDYAWLRFDMERSQEAAMPFDKIDLLVASARGMISLPPAAEEKRERLEALLEETDEELAFILSTIAAEHERIVSVLRARGPFDTLEFHEQSRRYHEQILVPALRPYLHRFRKGQLNSETLRTSLRTPQAVFKLAATLRETSAQTM